MTDIAFWFLIGAPTIVWMLSIPVVLVLEGTSLSIETKDRVTDTLLFTPMGSMVIGLILMILTSA